MSYKNVTVYMCDVCGVTITSDLDCGDPDNWLSVCKAEPGGIGTELGNYCSMYCLHEWATAELKKELSSGDWGITAGGTGGGDSGGE